MNNDTWTCPHCSESTTITEDDKTTGESDLLSKNSDGDIRLINHFIVCPNQNCKKVTLKVWLHKLIYIQACSGGTHTKGDLIEEWQLIPTNLPAKFFSPPIPKVILDDYNEACSIRKLSPKASATLARRCIQGMIRDFWKVESHNNLAREIQAIKDKVDPRIRDGIDAIREIGNIGAHMENDINLIVDIDPEEAEDLLRLIEMLLQDWYVLREEKNEKLKQIKQINDKKQDERKASPNK